MTNLEESVAKLATLITEQSDQLAVVIKMAKMHVELAESNAQRSGDISTFSSLLHAFAAACMFEAISIAMKDPDAATVARVAHEAYSQICDFFLKCKA